MKKIAFLIAGAAMSLAAVAQTEVSEFRPGVTLEGITYCLPKTAIRVVVTAEKTAFTPGELHKYASRYLRIDDVRTQGETVWQIKTVSIEPYGVPDMSKVYTIALRQKTIAPLVTLTADGRLMAIHAEADEPQLSELPQGAPLTAAPEPRRYFTQEMLTAVSKAKLSELVAQEIMEIRDSHRALTRGEAENTPKDGRQLELMLSSLRQQEQELTSLFTGYTQTATEVFELTVVPSTDEGGRAMIARFSRQLGLVGTDNLAGAPLYLSMRQLETLPEAADDPATAKKKAKMTQGVYYNVPCRAEIVISDDRRIYLRHEMPMAQLGRPEILSDALFNKGVATRVLVSPITGAVTKISED